MAIDQIKVLLAARDSVQTAPVAQALIQAGATLSIVQVRSAIQMLDYIGEHRPHLLVLEFDPVTETLGHLRAEFRELPMVIIFDQKTRDQGQIMFTLGVQDVWTLPMDSASLKQRAETVMQRLRSALQNGTLPDNAPVPAPVSVEPPAVMGSQDAPALMTGGNPRMAEIRDTIEKVSGTDVTVLIRGESGVGKEVAARMIFEHSRRRQKPFVKVNCAAIPHDLLESELFGYEAGAFTGAVRSKPGKFELADRGTLFLDEIAEMHPSLQAKLLHVLQDGRFSRLGAKRDVSVDVRIVCATNKLLEERVREGLFREDLLYRINVVTIFLPPLRERRDEIPVLTNYLLQKFAVQYGRGIHPLSAEVSRRMMEYDWPGNIRELENLCKRFVLVGSETQILRELSNHNNANSEVAKSVPEKENPEPPQDKTRENEVSAAPASTVSLLEIGRRAAWEAERRAIIDMLEITRWNRREAARRLQVSYKALLNKIKQMHLDDIGVPIEENGSGKVHSQKW